MSFDKAIQFGNAVGKTKATFGLVIGIILMVLLTPLVGWLLLRKRTYDTYVKGNIKNIVNDQCEAYEKTIKQKKNGKTTNIKRKYYKCDVTYEYKVKSKTYKHKALLDRPTKYKVGDSLDVYYNSRKPKDAALMSDDYRVPGAIISSILFIVVIGLFSHYYMVSNIKGYGSYTVAMNMMRPRSKRSGLFSMSGPQLPRLF